MGAKVILKRWVQNMGVKGFFKGRVQKLGLHNGCKHECQIT